MKTTLSPLALIFLFVNLAAQSPLTLADYIQTAQSRSLKSKLAQTRTEISRYQYQSFLSDLRPQISFYGSLPAYSRDYFDVRQPDGTIKFLPRSQNFSNIGFALSQQILATGGVLSLRTDLSRFDDFNLKTKSYNSTPVYLRLDQPLFGFNELKWNKKIEPLKLEESGKSELLELQKIAVDICHYYFEVAEAQLRGQMAEANRTNILELLELEERRILLGTTSEEKILQLRLQLIQSRQQADQARYQVQVALLRLNAEAGLQNGQSAELALPEELPVVQLSADTAVYYARKLRPEFLAFQRSSLEAEREVRRADAARKSVNLSASFGYNNAADEFGDLLNGALNQQRLSIGIDLPLVDWGRRDARVQAAKALQRLTQFNNELNEQNYTQEILTSVNTLELLHSNIQVARETESIAMQRFEVSLRQYRAGRLGLTELNIARQEKDEARVQHIQALRDWWSGYYELRQLTLYDFESGREIQISNK